MALYGYESKARFIGTMSAIGFALFTFVLCSYTNMSATVRPHDTEILIDMEPEPEPEPEPQKIEVKAGIQPRTEEPEPKKPIKLVQKSQAQTVAKRANEGPESTVGDKGDVEVPEPPREKEINKRALFTSAQNSNKDTTAQQVAEKISESLAAGHPPSRVVVDLSGASGKGYAPEFRMRLSTAKLESLGWRPRVGLLEAYEQLISSWRDA
jgi:hypothetical protein